MAYNRAAKNMAGLPDMESGILCCPNFFFIFPDQGVYTVKNMCIYTPICLRTDFI